MFSNLRISSRLGILIGLQIILLAIGGYFAFNTLRSSNQSIQSAYVKSKNLLLVKDLEANMFNFREMMTKVDSAAIPWNEGLEIYHSIDKKNTSVWNAIKQQQIDFASYDTSKNNNKKIFEEALSILEFENTTNLSQFVKKDLVNYSVLFNKTLSTTLGQNEKQAKLEIAKLLKTTNIKLYIGATIIIVSILLMITMAYLFYKSLVNPMRKITDTVSAFSKGDFDVRSSLSGSSELTELGDALDDMLDDKVNTLIKSEQENNQLNDSVFSLLEAVSTLSERDLTVNVPVNQDITGTLADAINLMVDEIVEVLTVVNNVANKVGHSSKIVSIKATDINESIVIQKELSEITSQKLKDTSIQLNEIAKLAKNCNSIANETTNTTKIVTETVSNTLTSMNEIRESIQETAKKIKGLGERSQEISAIVDIINTLSERTHVLALNASMQAAAAGEAGRGFAVVADEVQRLSQSSRDATAQISTLVKNIQFDTSETILTMDETITNVVQGSNFAKEAGVQIKSNNQSTQLLVTSVGKIADFSVKQAKVGASLVSEADKMIEHSTITSEGMKRQVIQTKDLLAHSIRLIKSVRVFKLPQKTKS